MIDPVSYFLIMLKGSMLSTGGTGNLPSLHQDFLARGWAHDQQFAEGLAIGQLAPGPTGLWVVAFGYLTYGLAGAVLSAVAIMVPPLAVLPLARLHGRFAEAAPVRGFVAGLALSIAATVPIVVLRVVGSYGFDLVALVILGVSFGLLASRRVSPLMVLGLGGLIGVFAYH
jgi:chromate transporter